MVEVYRMSAYYSPLRYPGGKNCIFPFVSRLFYENQMIGMQYAEPYAGGAGLALRLLFEGYVDHIYINDFDPSIYAFWKTITENSDEFCEWIQNIDVSIDNWKKYKDMQKNPNTTCSFDLAKSTFFLNRTNVSGVIKGGVIGGIEQLGKYKIDARFNKKDLTERILKIGNAKHRITVSNYDGIQFIKNLDKKKKDIFIYLDPPYFKKGSDLYMNYYREQDHQKLSKNVINLKKKWMVSYDNQEFIFNLYTDKRKIIHKLSQSASNRVGDEIIIFSELIQFENSMNSLKSPELCLQLA